MVKMNREKVEERVVAEPCGGEAVADESVWGAGAVLVGFELGTEPDAEGEGEGPSTVALFGAGGEVEGP